MIVPPVSGVGVHSSITWEGDGMEEVMGRVEVVMER